MLYKPDLCIQETVEITFSSFALTVVADIFRVKPESVPTKLVLYTPFEIYTLQFSGLEVQVKTKFGSVVERAVLKPHSLPTLHGASLALNWVQLLEVLWEYRI